MKIHHLGVAVTNLEDALEAMGLGQADVVESKLDLEQGNWLHFVYIKDNDLWLEFVEPAENQSTVLKFLKRKGNGLHHLGFEVKSMVDIDNKLPKSAIPIGKYQINVPCFGGALKTFFVSTKGFLIEYLERI